LLDIGCGTGNILQHIVQRTSVGTVHGMDVSSRCLDKTRESLDCPTHLGSILDDRFVASLETRFDFVLLAAVLHHLIGRTRSESKRYVARALRNALTLLKPNGYLIVLEPIFYPSLAMDCVFYLKKVVSSLTSRRVPLFDRWSNIGAPVVSYLTNEELVDLVTVSGQVELVERQVEPAPLPRPLWFLRKTNTTLVVRRTG
jgi:SAM-dependent methyltransferase